MNGIKYNADMNEEEFTKGYLSAIKMLMHYEYETVGCLESANLCADYYEADSELCDKIERSMEFSEVLRRNDASKKNME